MKKMTIQTFLALTINNFLAIPYFIISIVKKKENPTLMSLFFSVFGFYLRLLKPNNDLIRYYEIFELNDITKSFVMFQQDIYAKFLVRFLFEKELPMYFLPFISAFITYYFAFKSLKVCMINKTNGKIRLLYYLILVILIPIIGYSGIRFSPAISVMLYAWIKKENREKSFIFYGFFSICIHFTMIFPYFLLLISWNKPIIYKNTRKILIISVILGLFFNYDILYEIVKKLNEYKLIYIDPIYIIGAWGKLRGVNFPIHLKIIYIYIPAIFIRMIVYLYSLELLKDRKSKKKIATYFLLSFICITINFMSISGRFLGFLSLIIYLEQVKKNKKNKFLILVLVTYYLFLLARDIYNYYPDFIYSYGHFYKISLLNTLLTTLLKN